MTCMRLRRLLGGAALAVLLLSLPSAAAESTSSMCFYMDKAGSIESVRIEFVAASASADQGTRAVVLPVPFEVNQLDVGSVTDSQSRDAIVLAGVRKTTWHGLSGKGSSEDSESLTESTPVILEGRGEYTLVHLLLPTGQSGIAITLHGVGLGALREEGTHAVFRYCPLSPAEMGKDAAALTDVPKGTVIWACDTYRVSLSADGTDSISMEQKGCCYEGVVPLPPRKTLSEAVVWFLSCTVGLTAGLTTVGEARPRLRRASRRAGFFIELALVLFVWLYWIVAGVLMSWLLWPVLVTLFFVVHFVLVMGLGSIN